MSLFRILNEARDLTEREADICAYVIEHPEEVAVMSCRSLGMATFTSSATVTRFCKKLGFRGYPDFKLRLAGDLAAGRSAAPPESVRLASDDSLLTVVNKVEELETRALSETREAIDLAQLRRVQRLMSAHRYIDIYAYDLNVLLAQYAANLFVYAGKTTVPYVESNEQVLHALECTRDHLALILSHTGESRRLIELARMLRMRRIPVLVITSSQNTTLAPLADECLLAPNPHGLESMSSAVYSTACKFLLDLLYALAYHADFDSNMKLNDAYEKIGEATFWNLTPGWHW